MTAPPLPESPCVRVRLDYTQADGYLGGNRFYLSYSGGAPSGGNCTTLAGDVATQWATHIAPLLPSSWALTEVDVLDIATTSGLSGQWSGSEAGSDGGNTYPSQVATNVEFGIARRYRGGKPRIFLPGGTQSNGEDAGHWSADYVASVNTGVGAFFTALEALDIGSMGTLNHVNLSMYLSFQNVTNSSGRIRAAPKYRTVALVDNITGYSCKAKMGSQRRRRTATTY